MTEKFVRVFGGMDSTCFSSRLLTGARLEATRMEFFVACASMKSNSDGSFETLLIVEFDTVWLPSERRWS